MVIKITYTGISKKLPQVINLLIRGFKDKCGTTSEAITIINDHQQICAWSTLRNDGTASPCARNPQPPISPKSGAPISIAHSDEIKSGTFKPIRNVLLLVTSLIFYNLLTIPPAFPSHKGRGIYLSSY